MRDPHTGSARHPLEAVAACTRALAGSRAFAVALTTGDARSLAALRAIGDRVAVREQFHDSTCHEACRPRGPAAADLFDALEAARLDVRGLHWLPGVAVNLMGHPGLRPHLIRWLAFEILAGRAAPVAVANEVARLRRTLPTVLVPGLMALRPLIDQQPDFAHASAVWADIAATHGWCTLALTSVEEPEIVQPSPSPGFPGDDIASAAREADVADMSEAPAPDTRSAAISAGRGNVAANRAAAAAGYVAYTTAYDRVVDASTLTEPAEAAELCVRLDRELGGTRLAVTRLANRLRRALQARQVRQWRFDLDEGWVDGRRLAGVIAAPGEARPFKQETDSPFPTAVVSLLIDHSGSMRGRPILMAALTVEILVQALERCGVRCEVLGFTTRDWAGGRPARQWMADGQPENPGRLNALEHIILKAAEVPWRRARGAMGLVLRHDMLKENVDGEAVLWARARLCRRPERRRVLIVVSDGAPRDEATERANGTAYLTGHLRAVVEEIEEHSPVQIAAIGVGHDVSRFYSRAVTITRVEDLGEALSETLVSFLSRDLQRESRAAAVSPGAGRHSMIQWMPSSATSRKSSRR